MGDFPVRPELCTLCKGGSGFSRNEKKRGISKSTIPASARDAFGGNQASFMKGCNRPLRSHEDEYELERNEPQRHALLFTLRLGDSSTRSFLSRLRMTILFFLYVILSLSKDPIIEDASFVTRCVPPSPQGEGLFGAKRPTTPLSTLNSRSSATHYSAFRIPN